MEKDYSFIVKLTNDCNMRCKYCYHFKNEGNLSSGNMSISIIDATIYSLLNHNEHYAHFIWHGGEPLLRGIKVFEYIVRRQKEILSNLGKEIVISNGIQTNGTLLNTELIDFFAENGFNVGISLDGDYTVQNSERGMSPSEFQNLLESIHYMNDKEMKFGVLCVVGPNTINKEKELFDFYVNNGIFNIGFLPLVIENNGYVDTHSTISPKAYGGFLRNFFDIWTNSGIKNFSVREFDDYLRYKLGMHRKVCTNTGECDIYYTILPDGGIYPCDCFAANGSNHLSDVTDILPSLHESTVICDLISKTKYRPSICSKCEYVNMCQCGCSYYRMLSDAYMKRPSYFCQSFRMLYRYMDDSLKEAGFGR